MNDKRSYKASSSSRSTKNNSARKGNNKSSRFKKPYKKGFGSASASKAPRSGSFKRYGKKIDPQMYVYTAKPSEKQAVLDTNARYSEYNFSTRLLENIEKKGFKFPTWIQSRVIPNVMVDNDILGIASTGSGKTAAFLLPLIDKATKNRDNRVLIVAPTRELASQIKNELNAFTLRLGLSSVLVIGKASMHLQASLLKKDPEFVICTPGRLLDLSNQKAIDLSQFNNIVLDEVDQMLDMGFAPDVKDIISRLPKSRQSLFFSATLSKAARALAESLLNEPVQIEIEKQEPGRNVHQNIVKYTDPQNKEDVLVDMLKSADFRKVLIFTKTKIGADILARRLQDHGVKVGVLHGDKTQQKRSRVLELYRENKIKNLIATDVASRGIDVKDITHVINYDEPATYTDYIHRIGRTGRIGNVGYAITFVK
ncbi:DEAD/DEAH box helicase [candidate division WWE3 bacterium]|uniref:DEAD/DEAH box helicase n=1 Tax=candidate division WWE3 bacterium TaxID=2053526 RepID=A0A955ED68_UNCKA|nr:DEAD/DEAH box helicase [candidate division WWE3 bacterium]